MLSCLSSSSCSSWWKLLSPWSKSENNQGILQCDCSKTLQRQLYTNIYMCTYEDLYCLITIKGVSIEDIYCTSIISPPLSSCMWQNFPVLHTSLPPSMETVHCGFVEMMQVRKWSKLEAWIKWACARGADQPLASCRPWWWYQPPCRW